MPLEIGCTFLYKHLYIIISHPFDIPERIIAVNLTTWRDTATELNDASCIANIGEHPFIKEKSYIYYRETIRPYIRDLQKAVSQELIIPNEKCSESFLNKILEGSAKSQFIPLWAIQVLQQQELI
jgi:hypothetical protein